MLVRKAVCIYIPSMTELRKEKNPGKKNINVLIQLAGEYHVCAELCRREILALPAPKNNPLFDIIAAKPDASRTVTIQVKTMANKQGWLLGKLPKPDPLPPDLYIVLVQLKKDETVGCYIFEYGAFLKRVARQSAAYYAKAKRDGTARKKLSFEWLDLKDLTRDDKTHLNNWSLLGF